MDFSHWSYNMQHYNALPVIMRISTIKCRPKMQVEMQTCIQQNIEINNGTASTKIAPASGDLVALIPHWCFAHVLDPMHWDPLPWSLMFETSFL